MLFSLVSGKLAVMVNFLCQLGWVPRYSIKSYSMYFCEGDFWMRLTFKLVNLEQSRLSSVVWMGLIQSVGDLNRTKTGLPWARRNSASRRPSDLNFNITSSLGLQPAGPPCRFCTCQPPWSRKPIPLNFGLSVSLSLSLSLSLPSPSLSSHLPLSPLGKIQKLSEPLMKEIKDDANRRRDISCSWIGRINMVKMLISQCYYPKQSTDSMQSLSNYHWHFSQN